MQPRLGILVRVIEDADRAVVTAGDDRLQQLQIQVSLAQRQDQQRRVPDTIRRRIAFFTGII